MSDRSPTPNSDQRLEAALAASRERIEQALAGWLPAHGDATRLEQAMRYAVTGGGKRIRPHLVYAAGAALGLDAGRLDGPACAVEMIHAYSLVHDDLPAMDDDDLRRGRPTCHRAFDEATAILAGDALQTLAFQLIAEDPAMGVGSDRRLAVIALLARASGVGGMAGGQAMDLAATGQQVDLGLLERIHRHKTGALIEACVQLPALLAEHAESGTVAALADYGRHLGLAFQIQDDILDEIGETDTLGKSSGADRDRQQPTYVSLLGLDEARRRARREADTAGAALEPLGARGAQLVALADYVVRRQR